MTHLCGFTIQVGGKLNTCGVFFITTLSLLFLKKITQLKSGSEWDQSVNIKIFIISKAEPRDVNNVHKNMILMLRKVQFCYHGNDCHDKTLKLT